MWVQTCAQASQFFATLHFTITQLPSSCLISISASPLPLQLLIQWIFAADSNDTVHQWMITPTLRWPCSGLTSEEDFRNAVASSSSWDMKKTKGIFMRVHLCWWSGSLRWYSSKSKTKLSLGQVSVTNGTSSTEITRLVSLRAMWFLLRVRFRLWGDKMLLPWHLTALLAANGRALFPVTLTECALRTTHCAKCFGGKQRQIRQDLWSQGYDNPRSTLFLQQMPSRGPGP